MTTSPPDGALLANPPVIAREEELARFDELLSRGSPTLVLVSGAAGTGKTVLVEAFLKRASDAGWITAGPLTVSPATEETEFTDALRNQLGVPAEPLPGSAVDRPEAMLGTRAQDSMLTEARTAVEDRNPLVATLRRRRPLLIAVDGYHPSLQFHTWLIESFLRDLCSSGGPVVVVFAERAAGAELIRPEVDEEIRVDAVGESSLRDRFAALGAELSPPAEPHEIEAWLSAIRRNRDLIDPLWTALALARRGERREA